MAHSHQNTLLSRLGFADPDRSDPKHTLACEYLCKQDVALKVLKSVGQDWDDVRFTQKPADVTVPTGGQEPVEKYPECGSVLRNVETPIMNGSYYIGFADVVIRGFTGVWRRWGKSTNLAKKDIVEEIKCHQYCPYCNRSKYPIKIGADGERLHIHTYQTEYEASKTYSYTFEENKSVTALVEVKVKRCDPADVVKQLKLYSKYKDVSYMIVATCHPVSQSTKDMLKREGIHHIYLGAGFEAYCAERRAEQPVSEEGL